jgi:hypothetical protein
MPDPVEVTKNLLPPRIPWNKGKLIGPKPPLRPKHVWSIRTRLQVEGRTRDLAMFNLAIDSKLRGCDVVAQGRRRRPARLRCRSGDHATEEDRPAGSLRTGRTDWQAIDDYIRLARCRRNGLISESPRIIAEDAENHASSHLQRPPESGSSAPLD